MIHAVKKEKLSFFSSLSEFEQGLARKGPAWLQQMRAEARLRFTKQGFPTVRDEEWRFTNVAPITAIPFRPAQYGLDGLSIQSIDRLDFADLQCHRLVFVNGYYSEELSSVGGLPEGVRLASLAQVLEREPAMAQVHLGHYAGPEEHAFNALNTAFMRDGAYVLVPKGKVVDGPIHLLFLSVAGGEATASYPRNLIVAESNSQVSIVESYIGLGDGVYFTNPITEAVVGDAAVVEHSKLQHEGPQALHVATLRYQQARSSSLISNSITVGGQLVRNNLTAVLAGDGAECTLNGLYLVTAQQHVDNHTRLEHAAPHCSSRELYKGILDGKSTGVFHGRILVHRGAQKTDSKQTNKNLLLSNEALINTKPQLEIYADDVKCTHGATIGQLDKDAIFYLRSRGIGEKAARSLLTHAFAGETIRRIKVDSLRSQLEDFLLRWLPGGEMVREAVQR